MDVKCARETNIDLQDVLTVLHDSGLGKHRPVGDRKRMATIIAQSSLIVGARFDGKLIGYARAVTDGAFVCYLVDLAVAKEHQRTGVGRKLVAELHRQAGDFCSIIVRTVPDATEFYARLGFRKLDDAYVITRKQ